MKKIVLIIVFIGLCSSVFAEKGVPAGQTSTPARQTGLPVNCTGDNVTYVKQENTIYGKGNVEINYQGKYIRADTAQVNILTKEAIAEGRVIVFDGVNVFTGGKVFFNYDTGVGEVDGMGARLDSWFAKGEHGQRIPDQPYYIKNANITTCDYDKPHYRLKASNVYIYPGDKVIAKNIMFYIKDVPVFYWPYFKKSLKDERSPWTIVPGYNNKFGKYLLTGYSMWFENFLGGKFEPTARLDYYEKRGWAAGFFSKYKSKDKAANIMKAYFIDDKAYEVNGVTEHKARGRFSVDHVQKITEDTRAIVDLNYLSDPTIISDFFRDEFEADIQPENYISVSKSTPWYQLNLMIKKRFQNFYTDLERLPELSFSIIQRQIGKTNLLYVGSASVGYLSQRFANTSNMDDYSAARFDTTHQLSYPKKYFGWLNIIPRIGTRQTYWSQRAKNSTVTTITTDSLLNIPIVTSTAVRKAIAKDTWRSIYFVGAGFTTKISRLFYVENEFWDVHQLRHLIEPGANYVYQSNPTVKAEDLLDFGDLAFKDEHIELGLRNKLQTKRNSMAWDLVDFWFGVNYYPRRSTEDIYVGDNSNFSHIFSNLKLRPFDWISVDMDAEFNQNERQVDAYNTDIVFYRSDKLSFGLGYRYRHDLDQLWTSEINYKINSDWAFRMQHRFEFNTGELEQQEYILIRDLHCWNLAFSFRQYTNIDETAAFVVFYPKAYPNIPITFGTTYFGADDTNKLNFNVD